MAWIRVIDESQADGKLRELYDRMTEPDGGVDNILKIHSLNPDSLQGHFEFYRSLMRGRSPLTRAQREMIAVTVSVANRCHYWVEHHGAGLRKLTKDDALVARLQADWQTAPICEGDRAMLGYAVKLTREPWAMAAEDVERLHRAGFSDAAVLDICQITGYFAFVNRLADGLGVELESSPDKG